MVPLRTTIATECGYSELIAAKAAVQKCLRVEIPEMDQEDLVQDSVVTYLEETKKPNRFRNDDVSPIWGIVRHKVSRYFTRTKAQRKRARLVLIERAANKPTEEKGCFDSPSTLNQYQFALFDAVRRKLSDRDRNVFDAMIEDRSQDDEDLASVFQTTEGAAQKSRQRIKKVFSTIRADAVQRLIRAMRNNPDLQPIQDSIVSLATVPSDAFNLRLRLFEASTSFLFSDFAALEDRKDVESAYRSSAWHQCKMLEQSIFLPDPCAADHFHKVLDQFYWALDLSDNINEFWRT